MTSYGFNIKNLCALENTYLIKKEYERISSEVNKVDRLKFKFVFLMISTVLSLIAFSFSQVFSAQSVEVFNIMLVGLLLSAVFFTIPIVLSVMRYEKMVEIKEITEVKIIKLGIE